MRRVALCLLIGACASPAQRPPDAPPRDVWQPFDRPGMRYGGLAMDGDGVWFIADQYPAPSQGTLFLTKTTTGGDVIVPATNVDGPGPLYYGRSSLTRTDAGVVVGFMREAPDNQVFVRAFDHDGVAIATPQRVEISNPYMTALTSAPDGHARLLTSVTSPMTNAVELVDLDATGAPTGTTVTAGTATDPIGSITTATLRDGSTLIAWDHGGTDGCTGGGTPAHTATAVVDPSWNITAQATLGDQPDRQEIGPVVASRDGAAYIEWTSITPDGSTVWLAPYAGLDVAVEITGGIPVLADAAHGALVGMTDDSMLRVQSFENTGAGLSLGDVHEYPPIDADPETYKSLAGAVSLGGTRYLLAWEEQPQDWSATRLYATIVDLADPVIAVPDGAKQRARVRTRPCI